MPIAAVLTPASSVLTLGTVLLQLPIQISLHPSLAMTLADLL